MATTTGWTRTGPRHPQTAKKPGGCSGPRAFGPPGEQVAGAVLAGPRRRAATSSMHWAGCAPGWRDDLWAAAPALPTQRLAWARRVYWLQGGACGGSGHDGGSRHGGAGVAPPWLQGPCWPGSGERRLRIKQWMIFRCAGGVPSTRISWPHLLVGVRCAVVAGAVNLRAVIGDVRAEGVFSQATGRISASADLAARTQDQASLQGKPLPSMEQSGQHRAADHAAHQIAAQNSEAATLPARQHRSGQAANPSMHGARAASRRMEDIIIEALPVVTKHPGHECRGGAARRRAGAFAVVARARAGPAQCAGRPGSSTSSSANRHAGSGARGAG